MRRSAELELLAFVLVLFGGVSLLRAVHGETLVRLAFGCLAVAAGIAIERRHRFGFPLFALCLVGIVARAGVLTWQQDGQSLVLAAATVALVGAVWTAVGVYVKGLLRRAQMEGAQGR